MDEASAAKLEELRLGAVSQGKEWLHGSLLEMSARQLRGLAAAGGVETRSDKAQLVDESLGTLHGGWVQPKMCFDMNCSCDGS